MTTSEPLFRKRIIHYIKKQDFDSALAIAEFEQAGIDELKHNLDQLCRALARFNKYDYQLYVAKRMISAFPLDPIGWAHAASSLISQGELEWAHEMLEKARQTKISCEYIRIATEKFARVNDDPITVALGNFYSLGNCPFNEIISGGLEGGNDLCNFSIAKGFKPAAGLMVCKDAFADSSHGVHTADGIQFMHSILARGNYSEDSDFPYGGYSNRLPSSALESRIELAQAFFVRSIDLKRFGHILTESIASIYPLLYWLNKGFNLNGLPIIVSSRFRKSARALAGLIGIDPCNIIITQKEQSILVRKLYIPTPTLILRREMNISHSEMTCLYLSRREGMRKKIPINLPRQKPTLPCALTSSQKSIKKKQERVYISRRRSTAERRLLCEEELEKELSSIDWFVLHPQDYPLEEQLSFYENAKYIAGCWGSAFHLLLGLRCSKCFVTMLTGDPLWDDHRETYESQFSSQNIPFLFIDCLSSKGELKKNWSTAKVAKALENSFHNYASTA